MDELMETTKDDFLAMLHPSGKYVKSIMHFQARLQRKHEPFPGQTKDVIGSSYTEEQIEVPKNLYLPEHLFLLTYISQDDFSKLTEEQRIVSAEKYSAANYQRRAIGIMSGPPPPTYVCNRCAQPGHWYKCCPLLISLLFFLLSTLMMRKSSDRGIFNQQWPRVFRAKW
uniref:Zinc knuckle CX2CX3GHX4C domain-containing protein n=2 Tax=Meloidogyne TaxID=189290 RepID=A0A6V7W2V8_MELEN|nr:unnamed protein product [Meloidogyne enterolobii]CAD2181463.1 unnamed protein product [Meloidogyne enterolobii]